MINNQMYGLIAIGHDQISILYNILYIIRNTVEKV